MREEKEGKRGGERRRKKRKGKEEEGRKESLHIPFPAGRDH